MNTSFEGRHKLRRNWARLCFKIDLKLYVILNLLENRLLCSGVDWHKISKHDNCGDFNTQAQYLTIGWVLLYYFFWVLPRCLNFIYRRFGTLYMFHFHRRCKQLTPLMNMEQTVCSETSVYEIQTPGNYRKERKQRSEHGESLKSRMSWVDRNDGLQKPSSIVDKNIYVFVTRWAIDCLRHSQCLTWIVKCWIFFLTLHIKLLHIQRKIRKLMYNNVLHFQQQNPVWQIIFPYTQLTAY